MKAPSVISPDVISMILLVAGTRFQATGQEDQEEDVVAEYEAKADCFGYYRCTHSHHDLIHLSWI